MGILIFVGVMVLNFSINSGEVPVQKFHQYETKAAQAKLKAADKAEMKEIERIRGIIRGQ